MESNAKLEFSEDGTSVKIVFKNDEPIVVSDTYYSKDEALHAIACCAEDKSLTEHEMNIMFTTVLAASNLPSLHRKRKPVRVGMIGVMIGPSTMFGAIMFSSMFARSQDTQTNAIEEPFIWVCPGCGEHARIICKDAAVSEEFTSKKQGLSFAAKLLKENHLSLDEVVKIREEIEKLSFPVGEEVEIPNKN